MNGTAVARVTKSSSARIKEGDLVVCSAGWQDYSVHAVDQLTVIDSTDDPVHYLSVLGTNGLTAYFGLLDVGNPLPGETVAVSAAAGSVGHLVGQIARIKGCRVVGIAGTDEKCQRLISQLGFDATVNYRSENFRQDFSVHRDICG